MSYVLRIAVKQFDDDRARDRCTLVNEYIKYWQAHEVELRHIGGNINQATKRINEWSLTGHLTPERLEEYLSFLLPFREKIFQHITDLDTLSHQILRR